MLAHRPCDTRGRSRFRLLRPLLAVGYEMKRTTIFLPANMLLNLQALALEKGESQATIIRAALAAYMTEQGYKPYVKPTIRVNHGRRKQ